MSDELLVDVLCTVIKWAKDCSAPNAAQAYSRCVVCKQAWWGDNEEHKRYCWVPGAKKAMWKKDNE